MAKNVFLTFLEGNDFLNYFGFWFFKFFMASERLSYAKYFEVYKLEQMRRSVNKGKNTHTKITASRVYFFAKKLYRGKKKIHSEIELIIY